MSTYLSTRMSAPAPKARAFQFGLGQCHEYQQLLAFRRGQGKGTKQKDCLAYDFKHDVVGLHSYLTLESLDGCIFKMYDVCVLWVFYYTIPGCGMFFFVFMPMGEDHPGEIKIRMV